MDAAHPRPGGWTWLGLAIALLGIPAVVIVAGSLGARSNSLVAWREIAILVLCGALLLLVAKGEKRPFASLGLRFDRPVRSLWQGAVLTLVLFGAAISVIAAYSTFGIRYGEGSRIAPSLWLVLLTVVRAGFAEELFYRGFAFSRIEEMTGSRWAAFAVTVAAFALFHFRGGWPGIVLALVLGAILTLYFMWKRDLLAAIIAHFLVDFIPNVLLPAIGAGD